LGQKELAHEHLLGEIKILLQVLLEVHFVQQEVVEALLPEVVLSRVEEDFLDSVLDKVQEEVMVPSQTFVNLMLQRRILKQPNEGQKVSSPFSILERAQKLMDFAVTKISLKEKRKTKMSKIFVRHWSTRLDKKWKSETSSR